MERVEVEKQHNGKYIFWEDGSSSLRQYTEKEMRKRLEWIKERYPYAQISKYN